MCRGRLVQPEDGGQGKPSPQPGSRLRATAFGLVQGSTLEERHTLSFWDALIIEAAARSGARRLLSEDLQTGRRIRNLTIENPFRSAS